MDFSFSEIMIIVLVAFIVFGPEKLPGIAQKIGRMMGKAKTIWRNMSKEIDSAVQNHHEK